MVVLLLLLLVLLLMLLLMLLQLLLAFCISGNLFLFCANVAKEDMWLRLPAVFVTKVTHVLNLYLPAFLELHLSAQPCDTKIV